jgi:hypothetical protein
MTAKPLLTALLPLVSDLSRELPDQERYRRLLQAMRACCRAMPPRCCAWTANGWCRWRWTA